jgi:4-aminobutyrate aminotransferase
MRAKLEGLMPRHSAIVDVRGRGLMLGVEMKSAEIREAVINECFRRGLLVLGAGRTTIRLSPPLIIDKEQAEFAVEMLSGAIAAVAA